MVYGNTREGGRRVYQRRPRAQVPTDGSDAVIAPRDTASQLLPPPHTAVAGLCGLNRAVRSGRGDLPGECAAMSESVRRRLCAEWRKGDLPRASGSKRPAGLRGEPSVIRSRRGTAA